MCIFYGNQFKLASIFLFIGIFFSYCSKIEKPEIAADKFAEILIEVHYLEATLEFLPPLTDTFFLAAQKGYQQIFEKNEITEEQFFTTFKYYEEHPEKFEKIYEHIVTQLQEDEAKAKKITF